MDLNSLANGPKVYVTLNLDLPDGMLTLKNIVTQTTVSIFIVTVILISLSLAATRKLDKKRPSGLQVIAEKLVTMLYGLVESTMGAHNLRFAPYIGTLFMTSLFSTLIGMTNIFRSATADISVTAAWAIVTTGMVWYNNIKNFGFKSWLKGFTEPIVVMTPMNIVSEIASPVSMAFRHFGNVAGGSVLTALIYAALAGLSHSVLSLIPGAVGTVLSNIPIFQAGIPAVLSIYFDLFSGFVQAFVFCLLTMVYVGGACPPPEELPERPKKKKKTVAEKKTAKAN